MKEFFNISEDIRAAEKKALEKCKDSFDRIDAMTEYNQQKVLKSFIDNMVSEAMFAASTGYGYGDRGREVLEKCFAQCFGAEDAIVRHSIASGTHALGIALYGILRPGDLVLSVTGTPYDTIHSIFGITECSGSLQDLGVKYNEVDLLPNGDIDLKGISDKIKAVDCKVKMVYIQRSRGYSLRPSLTIEKIKEICDVVKALNKDIIIMVDNCYGEFVQEVEPTQVGADIMAGSLIKNPGGGIAPCGGYIAGRHDLVELAGTRLTVPGVGREVGASLGFNRELFMGLFNSPHVTGESLKTAVFASAIISEFGFDVTPSFDEKRGDIIQVVKLKTSENLVAFCQGVQSGAPVDSFVMPEPWDMPGYDSQVIMADGSFILGASIEFSCDAPLREPFSAWMQGGLNFHSAKVGILLALESMRKKNLI